MLSNVQNLLRPLRISIPGWLKQVRDPQGDRLRAMQGRMTLLSRPVIWRWQSFLIATEVTWGFGIVIVVRSGLRIESQNDYNNYEIAAKEID